MGLRRRRPVWPDTRRTTEVLLLDVYANSTRLQRSKGHEMKIVNLSIQSVSPLAILGPARELEEEEGLDIEVFCCTGDEAEGDPLAYRQLVQATKEADMVIVRCMSDPHKFKRFERYEKLLKGIDGYVIIHSGDADVRLSYRDLFKGTDEDFVLLSRYLSYRGLENERGPILWLNRALGGRDIPLPEPFRQRGDGIYHPLMDRDISLDSYLGRLDPELPTVGLMFTANYWIYDNTDHIDALILGLEDLDVNVLPIFFSVQTSKAEGAEGTIDIVRRYMMDGDRPRIDALIINSPFSQLMNSREDGGMTARDEENFFKMLLDVPVFQAMTVNGRYVDFEGTAEGLGRAEISLQVAWPEVDGQIITVPISEVRDELKASKQASPLPGRIGHLARLVRNWAVLRRKPPAERKIAILMYQSRPDSGRIGNAAGLDVIESVHEILNRMHAEGYMIDNVPRTSKELLSEILDGVTNDLDWTPAEVVREKAAGMMDLKEYRDHFDRLSEFNQRMIKEQWGEPPGEICVDDGRIVIPGLLKGNVFIGYQPIRGWGDQIESIYHDPMVSVPHHYIAYYRWIQDVFGADMVIHMGTHGTLEWLPGRGSGLSDKCEPDLVLNSLPHMYPYVIDDPGEGIQAKRRSEAVLIGHLNPTMARADSYDDLAPVEVLLQEYLKFRNTASQERKDTLAQQIYEAAKSLSLFDDLNIDEDPGPNGFAEHIPRLHDYLAELKDALIRNGLHVIGRVPRERHLDEVIYSLTRLRNGDVPSLRTALAETLGLNIDAAMDGPSQLADSGELNSEIIDRVDEELQRFLEDARSLDHDPEGCMRLAEERWPNMTDSFIRALDYALNRVVPNVKRTSEEMDNLVAGMDGRYVLPGPSGAPTRGNADILPMGRNYFGIDPDAVPTPSAWKTGVRMAEQMIDKYVQERGSCPREVGFIIWATDTMKTNGDDVAYILWLMGVRPVWSRVGGQVVDLEVVPLSELKRPRIDVTVRITGLFRDAFPNLIDMMDEAVELVAGLDESDEENYLVANLRKDIIDGVERGLTVEESRRRASARVFGCPPGAYGPGVNHIIETGEWETTKDLADIYVTWGSHAYGRRMHGESMRDEFIKRFSKVGITVKNMPDREIDLFDIDDVYGYLGGLNAFVREYGDPDAMTVMGDSSDPDRLKIRDTTEECRFVFRSKILNPKYLNGLKEHGHRGAMELAKLTEHMIGWDATSAVLDDWMYEQVAEKFLFDQDTRRWMEEENPQALMEMLSRLQEAIDRGLWDADNDTRDRLKEMYMEAEELIEEATDR